MTIAEILAEVDEIKPNTYDDNIKISWLSELEGKIYEDVILTHERPANYDEEGNVIPYEVFDGYTEADLNTDLLIEKPHTDVYKNYLYAMMDFANGETERYQNSMIMFNKSYSDYTKWFNRTHKPIQKAFKLF